MLCLVHFAVDTYWRYSKMFEPMTKWPLSLGASDSDSLLSYSDRRGLFQDNSQEGDCVLYTFRSSSASALAVM